MAAVALTRENVLEALYQVNDPDLGRSIVALGMVKEVGFEGAVIKLDIELTTPACPMKGKIEGDIREALSKVYPESPVQVAFGANVKRSVNAKQEAGQGINLLTGVKNIILVGSGKGGVGKSTVAANLAAALLRDGAKVGLCDADIYGPSVPTLFTVTEQPTAAGEDRLNPLVAEGLKLMSVGYLVDPEQAMIWRGPMLHSAIRQFLMQVEWGELDYLIIDLPPGTGDVQLSISQTVRATGAVIVSTPQDLALVDVVRAKAMFDKVNIPILGVIENMSFFKAPDTGKVYNIFGNGGAEKMAARLKLHFLGRIPIEVGVREWSDEGRPIVWAEPETESARALVAAARNVAAEVSKLTSGAGAGIDATMTLAAVFAMKPEAKGLLYDALNLRPAEEKSSLAELAAARGIPVEDIVAAIEAS